MEDKRWEDFTEEEINKIKKEKCSKCKYSSRISVSKKDNNYFDLRNMTCDYFLKTGNRRPCRPDECELYKEDI